MLLLLFFKDVVEGGGGKGGKQVFLWSMIKWQITGILNGING